MQHPSHARSIVHLHINSGQRSVEPQPRQLESPVYRDTSHSLLHSFFVLRRRRSRWMLVVLPAAVEPLLLLVLEQPLLEEVHAVARVHLVLGLAAVAFALCVATLHPELKQQGGECAATEADAVIMRTHGLLLLLSAGAQAAAAAVAAFAPNSRSWLCWTFTTFAHGVSAVTYFHHLIRAFDSVAAVAVGSCPGHVHAHKAEFIAHGVLLFVPLCLFFGYGVLALFVDLRALIAA